MINTSLDILWIVLAASVGVLTIFLCWALYYVVRALRNGVYMIEKVTTVMQKADEVLDMAKDKLHSTGTYLSVVANLAKGVMEYVGERGMDVIEEKKKKTKRRKKK
jgi:hypothetical protein